MEPYQYPIVRDFMAFVMRPEVAFDEITTSGVIFQHREFSALIDFCCKNPEVAEIVVGEVIRRLPEMDVFKACVAALCVGSITEGGVPCPSSVEIVNYFIERSWRCVAYLKKAAGMLEVGLDELEPEALEKADQRALYALDGEGYKTFVGSYYLIMCVMSRICRERSLRESLRQVENIEDLCGFLAQYVGAYGFVSSVLELVEEEDIIILSPEQGVGLEVTVRQLDSNFLFFTLFQIEMYHRGWLEKLGVLDYKYDPVRDQRAHNLVGEDEREEGQDSACMEYYTYKAYQPDGTYSILMTGADGKQQVNPENRVWGEGNIYEIPRLDDRIVILVDSHPLMSRSWGKGFTTPVHGAIRPDVTLKRQLSDDEFDTWMQKVKNN